MLMLTENQSEEIIIKNPANSTFVNILPLHLSTWETKVFERLEYNLLSFAGSKSSCYAVQRGKMQLHLKITLLDVQISTTLD